MNPKKENRKKYIILVSVVIAMLLLWVTAYSISKERELTFIEKGIKDTVLTIGNILGTPVRYVKDKWEVLKSSEEIYQKYEEMMEEYTTLEQYEESIRELKEENESLKKILDLDKSLSNYEKVHATIINRNMNYWLDSFTIDKGSNDGIKKDMAVMGNGELVGYISQVSNSTSVVKLLTNSNFSNPISVKIQLSDKKYAYGLLTGYSKEKQVYLVEGISDYVEIPVSSKVTTTGLGDRFPSGLLIGTVLDIETDSFDLAKIVYAKSALEVEDMKFITILIREGEQS